MVRRAVSRCWNSVVPSRTIAIARMECVAAAAEHRELLARGRAIDGFGEPALAQRQGLVGAEHQMRRAGGGNRPCLLAREQTATRRAGAVGIALLELALVDVGWHHLDRNARVVQDGLPNCAPGGKHKRPVGKPECHG